jgi:hypothetical protein
VLVPYDPFENLKLDNILEEILACHCQVYGQDLMRVLEYSDRELFQQAVVSAMKACTALDIPVRYHFKSVFIGRDDGIVREYKLSGLACYFVTMNADSSYRTVAQAQLYYLRRKPSHGSTN